MSKRPANTRPITNVKGPFDMVNYEGSTVLWVWVDELRKLAFRRRHFSADDPSSTMQRPHERPWPVYS